ncbi:MAG: hypothetical protein GOMPHAMPRED_000695 [Gomphillus americanus]|uniref:Nucleoside phosphorylase domain-containing protein n=1 Tax=Gomphillus americanus TaxID=1940652 RepID=A0A8H3F3F5_9LECA|nr:MAG: hypothetical protein GOMPHAMPRED_000695 [Gomphillus americanus]
MSNRTEHYTVAWICSLETEYLVACELLDEEYSDVPWIDQSVDPNTYKFGRMHEHSVVIACLPKGSRGADTASMVAARLMITFRHIRFGLMVGIAGGAPSLEHDIRLGDVVVSSLTAGYGGVIQYDYGKAIQGQEFWPTRYLTPPPEILRSALVRLGTEHTRNSHQIQKTISDMLLRKPELLEVYSRPSRDDLYKASYVHSDGETCDCRGTIDTRNPANLEPRTERPSLCDDPVIHYGLIASASTHMRDAHARDALAKKHEVLCFEMEAAGLMDQFRCLVIRGIYHYADTHKNNDWQGYAAATAAAYAKELLSVISGTTEQHMSAIERNGSLLDDTHGKLAAQSSSVGTVPKLDAYQMSDADLHNHLGVKMLYVIR